MAVDVLGASVKRVEDARFITGKGRYLDDIKLPSMAHMAILRSPYAHANIRSIDTSAARAMPGVVAVFTGADIPYNPLPMAWPAGGASGLQNNVNTPRALATDSVKWTGEGVAAVVADTAAQAQDALEAIRVEWEPRSALFNTDGQIFSDLGIPVVLFMENYDINRSGYHDTQDTMKNIDLDYGAALAAIAIETVARVATQPVWPSSA